MLGADTIHGHRLDTRKAPRAIFIGETCSAAEAPLFSIVDTDIFGPAHALAVVAVAAWLAEVRHLGDADKEQVRPPTGHLLATPTGGTFFLAGDGADRVSQVVNAPPRLTVAILTAGVEKAALARFAAKSGRQVVGQIKDQVQSRIFLLVQFHGDAIWFRGHLDGLSVTLPLRIPLVRRCLDDTPAVATGPQQGRQHQANK